MASKTRKKSPLTTIERLSPNRNKPRTSIVRGSTPHQVAGNLTIEAILGLARVTTYDPIKGMSMGYAIGSDGRIGLGVEETNRAWTSSSAVNDHRCITTEISNNGGAPDWRMSDEAINAWLDLTVEQCLFYGFKKVNYKEKPISITPAQVETWIKTWAKDDEWIITLHNWFVVTVCPGPYFERQLPWLVREMNKRLSDPSYKKEAFVGEGSTATGKPIPLPPAPTLKSIEIVAKEVLAGSWGNGQDRTNRLAAAGYDVAAVQAEVNRLTSSPAVSPVVPTPPTPTVTFKEYEVVLTAVALNLRKGPSVNEPVVRTLINDRNTYTIVEEKIGPSGSGGAIGKWGKLKSGSGWILLEFTKRK